MTRSSKAYPNAISFILKNYKIENFIILFLKGIKTDGQKNHTYFVMTYLRLSAVLLPYCMAVCGQAFIQRIH